MRTKVLVAAFSAAFLVPGSFARGETPVAQLIPTYPCPSVGFVAQLTGAGGAEAAWTHAPFGRQGMQPHQIYRSVNLLAHRDTLICSYKAEEGQTPKQEKAGFNLRRAAPADRPVCKVVGTHFVCRAMKPGEAYTSGIEY